MTLEKALEILNLNINFTEKELKKQYHKLALENHPDYNKSADAEENMKRIIEAKEVLEEYLRNKKSSYGTKNSNSNNESNNNYKNQFQKYIDDLIERLEINKDNTVNTPLAKYNKKIDDIILEFKNNIKNSTDMFDIKVKYRESMGKILEVFEELILAFSEENNIPYKLISDFKNVSWNLKQLHEKLLMTLKYFHEINNELYGFELINGYQNLKEQITEFKYNTLNLLIKYGDIVYQDLIEKLKINIKELFKKYFDALYLTNSFISDIEEFNKYFNNDKVLEIYKQVIRIQKNLENNNQLEKFINHDLKMLNIYQARFNLIKKSYYLLDLYKEMQLEDNNEIKSFYDKVKQTIIKNINEMPSSNFFENVEIFKKYSYNKYQPLENMEKINAFFIYIHKNPYNQTGQFIFVNIKEFDGNNIIITDKANSGTLSISKDEFIDNYILLPELMYCKSTILFNKDSEELIFTNSLLSIIYSYQSDKVLINFEPYINSNDKISEIKPSEELFNEIVEILDKIKIIKSKTRKRSKNLNN